jgi:hypothetical protein
MKESLYSSLSLVRPLPSKATSLIREDFRCTEMLKYYYIVIPVIRQLFHCRRGGLVKRGKDYCMHLILI